MLGSRYVEGGEVPDWVPRGARSAAAGRVYARVVLGVPIRDLTGGFKAIRREVLEAIDLASIASQGYAFQVEVTYRAARAGFRMEEVPIQFRERRVGKSKMSGRIVLEAAIGVPRMRSATVTTKGRTHFILYSKPLSRPPTTHVAAKRQIPTTRRPHDRQAA